MWSSKGRKKTGHPGLPISEGRVKEIERELGISKWQGGLCIGTLWQTSGRAGGMKREKKRETGGAERRKGRYSEMQKPCTPLGWSSRSCPCGPTEVAATAGLWDSLSPRSPGSPRSPWSPRAAATAANNCSWWWCLQPLFLSPSPLAVLPMSRPYTGSQTERGACGMEIQPFQPSCSGQSMEGQVSGCTCTCNQLQNHHQPESKIISMPRVLRNTSITFKFCLRVCLRTFPSTVYCRAQQTL